MDEKTNEELETIAWEMMTQGRVLKDNELTQDELGRLARILN